MFQNPFFWLPLTSLVLDIKNRLRAISPIMPLRAAPGTTTKSGLSLRQHLHIPPPIFCFFHEFLFLTEMRQENRNQGRLGVKVLLWLFMSNIAEDKQAARRNNQCSFRYLLFWSDRTVNCYITLYVMSYLLGYQTYKSSKSVAKHSERYIKSTF